MGALSYLALATCGGCLVAPDPPCLGAFGTRSSTMTANLDTAGYEDSPWLSRDQKEIMFSRVHSTTEEVLLRSTRATVSDPFPPPTQPPWSSAFNDNNPFVTADGLELYFTSNRPNGALQHSHRASRDLEFGPPEPYDLPNAGALSMTDDQLDVYYEAEDQVAGVFWVHRSSRDATFSTAVHVDLVVNEAAQVAPAISSDGTILLFAGKTTTNVVTTYRAVGRDGMFPDISRQEGMNVGDFDASLTDDSVVVFASQIAPTIGSADLFVIDRCN